MPLPSLVLIFMPRRNAESLENVCKPAAEETLALLVLTPTGATELISSRTLTDCSHTELCFFHPLILINKHREVIVAW